MSCNKSMIKVAVLTYPIKHRKTFDVLCLLKANGYVDVKVFAVPMHYKKKKFPRISHRPEMHYKIPDILELCDNFGYCYQEGQLNEFNIEEDRVVLIAGAGIIPDDFVNSHKIINSHPGYIPNCRGLDAFKWAIIEKQPIGVTSHLIGEFVDAGDIFERRKIEIKENDSFHAVAQRIYENEVSMLVEAIEKLKAKEMTFISPDDYPLHKRMPENIEIGLFEAFEEYKKIYFAEKGI